MATDPKDMRHDGSERRPSGAESKGEARADSGGHRSPAGTDYGDWVPDGGQPRGNDDRGAETQMSRDLAGSGDARQLGRDPGSPQAQPDREHDDLGRSSSAAAGDATEAAAESNRNKDFDTPHVHSSTTPRKV